MTSSRVVPSYVLTGGRTRARGGNDLPLEAQLSATAQQRSGAHKLQFERRRIAELSSGVISIAEVASILGIPLGTARVLVSDMVEEGLLALHLTTTAEEDDERPSTAVLERLLSGLRSR